MNEFDFDDTLTRDAAMDAMSKPQITEVAMNQSVLDGKMGFKQRNGRSWLDFNPNAEPEVVAFAGAVNEGQPMDRNKYLAAVDAVGLAWSADADGYNNDSLVEMAVNELFFDGAEEMFGPDVSAQQARGLVKNRVEEVMRRTHAFAKTEKDADTLMMEDIVKSIDARGWQRDLSDFSSDARLAKRYKSEKGKMSVSGAEKDLDLYNRFMGRGWQNGKAVEAKKWREEWWQEVKGNETMPKDEAGWQKVFADKAGDFAVWYSKRAEQESENYRMRYQLAARSEIMRRLSDARARGEKLSYAQQRAVVLAVLNSRDGGDKASPYDDAWHWPSVLTEEDVARVEERRMASIAGRRAEYETKAAEARGVVAGMRADAVAKKEAAALAKEQEAERKKEEKEAAKLAEKQKKEAAAEQEKAAKELEKLRKSGTPKVISGWGYDGRDKFDEPEGCRVHAAQLAAVRKQLNVGEDEVVYVQLKVRGKSAILLPVVADYGGEDYGVMLNARAQSMLTKAGKKGQWDPDAEGDGEVVFKVGKK